MQNKELSFIPIVENFSASEYGAACQNWAVSEHKDGTVYIANNNSLLEYNSGRWKKHKLGNNEKIIRSVFCSDDGKIYVGSFEEFGYFEKNKLNQLVYNKIDVKNYKFHNDEIWNITQIGDKIFFQAFSSFFVYKNGETRAFKSGKLPLNLFNINGKIYSQVIDGNFCSIENYEFKDFITRESLNQDDVVACLPFDKESLLLITRYSGAFIYDGELKKWETNADNHLYRNSVNRAVITKDSCYVIGTLSAGVFSFNKNGELKWSVNSDNCSINNTILGLDVDKENNIWAATDNGVALIKNNSDISVIFPNIKQMGMVYDFYVDNKQALIATNQGLYRIENRIQGAKKIKNLEEQAWTIERLGNQIICGHNKGTFEIEADKFNKISDVKGALSIKQVQFKRQDILIQGTYTLLNIYKKDKYDNKWKFSNSIKNFSQVAKNVEVDHIGNIWVQSMHKGIFKIQCDDKIEKAQKVVFYDFIKNNISKKVYLLKINGRIIFFDSKNFYVYDDIKDKIVPYQSMNQQLSEIKDVHRVIFTKDNLYWFCGNKNAFLVENNGNDFSIKRRVNFDIFKNIPIEGESNVVYYPDSNTSYICLNGEIAQIEHKSDILKSDIEDNLYISYFACFNDSGEKNILATDKFNEIEFSCNNIEIELSLIKKRSSDYKIKYILEGLNNSYKELQSPYQLTFLRLPYGNYTLKVIMVDENGEDVVAQTVINFEILRPFYLSYFMIFLYIAFVLFLMFCVYFASEKSRKRKRLRKILQKRLKIQASIEEKNRKRFKDKEFQLEEQLRFKSKDLSSISMLNISNQEFLSYLKEEIVKCKQQSEYNPKKILDRVLSILSQKINSEKDNWNFFQTNFDLLHDNFFKNLKQKYPNLSQGDLRLAALLKINMSTKDISRVLNISIRGVDAARYRLRKKLGLNPNESLTDFIMKI